MCNPMHAINGKGRRQIYIYSFLVLRYVPAEYWKQQDVRKPPVLYFYYQSFAA